MRIACTNHHRQLVGGTESYLKRIIPELARLGHTVSLWHEGDVPSGAASIDAPAVFKVKADSPARLTVWRPDVIFNHGLMQMDWETSLAVIAPVVHYAHNFYGTCISGEKTHKRPSPGACGRCFGPGCLVQYLPRGCGGLNPFGMWHDYQLQSQRLDNLRRATTVVTASQYMRNEYRKHGLTNVECAPLYVEQPSVPPAADPRRLLFCGRMTHLKGGNLLLDAIPEVERMLGRSVEVFFRGRRPREAKLGSSRHQSEIHRLDLATGVARPEVRNPCYAQHMAGALRSGRPGNGRPRCGLSGGRHT